MLSNEQVLATVESGNVYIEAFPGSGKTTVAAKRFGVLRFSGHQPHDVRAVIAASFTRAATKELRVRVLRTWGSPALEWPHRIVTIDTLVVELVHALLDSGAVEWPGGHRTIEVHDSWFALARPVWNRRGHEMALRGSAISTRIVLHPAAASRPPVADVRDAITAGVCTHDEMRQALTLALAAPPLRQAIAEQIAVRIRALVVDEVFDANPLDLEVVRLAAEAGVPVTLIGDPWQALYRFRGASPELVPALTKELECSERELSHSFRWRSERQATLARALRASEPVVLPRCNLDLDEGQVDVVISREWKQLWTVSARVLPLAFSGARGTSPEAAATLLLDAFARWSVGLRATNLSDALRRLRLGQSADLEEGLQTIIREVRDDLGATARPVYEGLRDLVADLGGVGLPKWNWHYRERLEWLIARLHMKAPLIPGLTAHQAKGHEWGVVGVAFDADDLESLGTGLDKSRERHRQLYVACTRARNGTLLV